MVATRYTKSHSRSSCAASARPLLKALTQGSRGGGAEPRPQKHHAQDITIYICKYIDVLGGGVCTPYMFGGGGYFGVRRAPPSLAGDQQNSLYT